jgi:hypothetical protein
MYFVDRFIWPGSCCQDVAYEDVAIWAGDGLQTGDARADIWER